MTPPVRIGDGMSVMQMGDTPIRPLMTPPVRIGDPLIRKGTVFGGQATVRLDGKVSSPYIA